MIRALALAGPTASGKSELAIAIAEELGGEIISVDSGAVYKKMDIGTAKPPLAMRGRVPHHMIDVCEPSEPFSAGKFCRLARRAAEDIIARGKAPIFAGGTALYFDAMSLPLHDLPDPPPEVRAQARRDVKERGAPAMHAELASLDERTAARIAPGDSQRIGRALELIRAAGRPLSDLLSGPRPSPAFEFRMLVMAPCRAALRDAIAARMDGMFAAGLVAETESVIREFGLSPGAPPLRMAGYRQATMLLRGECRESEAKDLAVRATRQLAKRQRTCFKRLATAAEIDSFEPDAAGRIAEAARRLLLH